MIPTKSCFALLCVVIVSHLNGIVGQVDDPKTIQKIKEIFNIPAEKSPSQEPTDQDGCECVNYYLCNGTHININGEGIIDIRISDNKCESYLEFCCLPPNVVPTKIQPHNPVYISGSTTCGKRNPDGVGFRIVGDVNNEAKFGEFPWMVAILRELESDGKVLNVYQCGGSLIHPQAVVTAAHCVNNKERSHLVRAGEWDTQTTKELLPFQTRNVKTTIIHPQFYSGALYNDVALLILDKPFDLDQHIGVACLPPQGIVIPSGTRCWASGWGKDLFGAEGKYQVILKKLDLPMVDKDTCQNSLRTTRLGKRFMLHESFVCAGGEPGRDTCQGDGGSPLVCPIPGEKDRYQHVGIVAWGIGCGETGIPGVYGNMALFRNWIDKEMVKNKLDTTPYQY